jgi:hypothetical protein
MGTITLPASPKIQMDSLNNYPNSFFRILGEVSEGRRGLSQQILVKKLDHLLGVFGLVIGIHIQVGNVTFCP